MSKLAEARILEAQARGEMDNLPGHGQPLVSEPAGPGPRTLRLAYKILKNHGVLPRELQLLKKIDAARRQVEIAPNDEHRALCLAQLEALCLDYNALKPRPTELEQSGLADIKKPTR